MSAAGDQDVERADDRLPRRAPPARSTRSAPAATETAGWSSGRRALRARGASATPGRSGELRARDGGFPPPAACRSGAQCPSRRRRCRALRRCRTLPAAARCARTPLSTTRAPTRAALRGTRGRRASRITEPDSLGEFLEHGNRNVVGSDDPVLADDAFERVQLALVVLLGRVRRDVDVAAVVAEHRSVLRAREAVAGLAVDPERLRHAVRVRAGVAIDIDPESFDPPKRRGRSSMSFSRSTLVTVEQDRFAHAQASSAMTRPARPASHRATVVRAAAQPAPSSRHRVCERCASCTARGLDRPGGPRG